MSIVTNIMKSVLPSSLKASLRCWRILDQEYGHGRSFKTRSCVDKLNQPIPWYTYPSIEYLGQLDFSDKAIFEYGSGNSTLFWSKRSKRVVSVENNREWYDLVKKQMPENVNLNFAADKDAYLGEINRHDPFDVIVVDGSYRFSCAAAAIKRLNPGGLIILDNSDWHIKSAQLLREADLLQVDMAGFGPINPYTSTTSFFFHRDFRIRGRATHQPIHGIGAIIYHEPNEDKE